jgi:hypothetical protein
VKQTLLSERGFFMEFIAIIKEGKGKPRKEAI